MSNAVQTIDSSMWEDVVLRAEKVVVDFYSDDCAPCEALAPKYESLAALYGDDVRFVKVFRQGNRELATSLGVRSSPTVLFFRQGQQVGPTLTGGIRRADMLAQLEQFVDAERGAELAAKQEATTTEADIVILGGGPAGLAAAIYAAQAKRKVVLVDQALPGGQVSTTHLVSNYPGFVEPQSGMMLGYQMFEQAVKAGTIMKVAVDVDEVDLRDHSVLVDGVERIRGRRLILATGSRPRLLGVPGEREYRGKGISYCATCDGKYYEGKHVLVVGGGNSAIEEALFLTQFAATVTIVHQFAELQANATAQEAARSSAKITFLLEQEPREFAKTETGMSVRIQSTKDGTERTLDVDGVFIFVGMVPNVELLGAELEQDKQGFVRTDDWRHASVPGVFAIGDIAAKPFRQITLAVADGTIAGIQAAREVEQELRVKVPA